MKDSISLKKKVVSFFLLLLTFTLISIPVFAHTNLQSFSFTCYYRQVDGSDSNKFYTFTPGVVQLDAHSWKDYDTNITGSHIYITFMRNLGVGLYKSYGQEYAGYVSNSNDSESDAYHYTLKWTADTTSSSYYFVVDCDGEFCNKYGSGTAYNP